MICLAIILGIVASYPLRLSESQDFEDISESLSNLRISGEEIHMIDSTKNVYVNKSHIIATIELGTPALEYEVFLTQNTKFTVALAKSSSHPAGFNVNESSTVVCENTLYLTFLDTSGKKCQDVVKYNNYSANNFTFYVSDSYYDYRKIGSLGLGYWPNHLGTTLMEHLWKNYLIEEPVYAIDLQTMEFTIGKKNPGIYSTHETYTVKSEDYGYIQMAYTGLGGNASDIRNVRLEIELNNIYSPKKYYDSIMLSINSTRNCTSSEDVLYCNCEKKDIDDFPILSFVDKNGSLISISAKNYVSYQSEKCYFYLSSKDYEYWILGRPFFKEYFTIFNPYTSEIEMFRYDETPINSWIYVAIGVTVVIVIAIIVGVIFYLKRSKERDYKRIE
ncbi:hypothetical protein SteCoe_35783 [Stentor coeruleus]|uniref:Peptidase A1 domain-containing protein n=1 Tax=Stentor coeruleus TaxID=5963 RepID=A0A1R2ARG7_9CILI|nr:hypothetical protein SteCoe_35783 [Stentor coeruleus]